MTPTTTLTVWRGPVDAAGIGVDPWDEVEQAGATIGRQVVASGVPATIASPEPGGLLEPSARQLVTPFALVLPGTDIRLGDEVVDEATDARYRITDVVERVGFSPHLHHRRIGLSRVTFTPSEVVS